MSIRSTRCLLLGLLLACLGGVGVQGEIVILKDGRIHRGQILSSNDREIVLRVEMGTLTIRRVLIEKIEDGWQEIAAALSPHQPARYLEAARRLTAPRYDTLPAVTERLALLAGALDPSQLDSSLEFLAEHGVDPQKRLFYARAFLRRSPASQRAVDLCRRARVSVFDARTNQASLLVRLLEQWEQGQWTQFGQSLKGFEGPQASGQLERVGGKEISLFVEGALLHLCRRCDDRGLESCRTCKGRGKERKRCPGCRGSRRILVRCGSCSGRGFVPAGGTIWSPCSKCNTTKKVSRLCTECEGKGKKEQACRTCDGRGGVRCQNCGGRHWKNLWHPPIRRDQARGLVDRLRVHSGEDELDPTPLIALDEPGLPGVDLEGLARRPFFRNGGWERAVGSGKNRNR